MVRRPARGQSAGYQQAASPSTFKGAAARLCEGDGGHQIERALPPDRLRPPGRLAKATAITARRGGEGEAQGQAIADDPRQTVEEAAGLSPRPTNPREDGNRPRRHALIHVGKEATERCRAARRNG